MTKPYYLMPDDENYISKTDIKKEVKELQEFATNLVALGKSQRAKLTASDELRDAFLLADKIRTKPDALRRHMQFMAKLLKDEDLDALRTEYRNIKNPVQKSEKFIKQVEDLRDTLIKEGDAAINSLIEKYPNAERQKVRQLVRQAKKELEKEKPGKNYKELFQYVKTLLVS